MTNKNIMVGMEVTNKINGKRYAVTAVDAAKNTATLTEVLAEDAAEDAEVDELTLTDANAVCFKLDPSTVKPVVPEGYDITDGVLTQIGAPVTVQGQLVFKKILGYVPGKIILAAETLDKDENRSDIFAYDVANDKFEKLMRGVGEVELFAISGDRLMFSNLVKDSETVYDEDGEPVKDDDGEVKKVEVVKDSQLVILDGKGSDILTVLGTVDRVTEVLFNGQSRLVIESDNSLGFSKEVDGQVVEERNDVYLTIVELDGTDFDGRGARNFTIPTAMTAVTMDLLGNMVIKAEGYMFFENNGHNPRTIKNALVDQLAGFDYLVETDIRNGKEIYTFADADMNTRTIVRTKTYDRGDIITIE